MLKTVVEIPWVVLTSWEVLTYPMEPRPVTVLTSCDKGKIPAVVLTNAPVLTNLDTSKIQDVVLTS